MNCAMANRFSSALARKGWRRVWREIFVDGAAFRRFIRPIETAVGPADIELYLAELRRCAELVKQKYGARLVILYLGGNDKYLAKSGFTDAMIEDRLRRSGIDLIDATLSPKDFPPGTLLAIPGDGHPTAIANRARAALLQHFLAVASASSGATVTLK